MAESAIAENLHDSFKGQTALSRRQWRHRSATAIALAARGASVIVHYNSNAPARQM